MVAGLILRHSQNSGGHERHLPHMVDWEKQQRRGSDVLGHDTARRFTNPARYLRQPPWQIRRGSASTQTTTISSDHVPCLK